MLSAPLCTWRSYTLWPSRCLSTKPYHRRWPYRLYIQQVYFPDVTPGLDWPPYDWPLRLCKSDGIKPPIPADGCSGSIFSAASTCDDLFMYSARKLKLTGSIPILAASALDLLEPRRFDLIVGKPAGSHHAHPRLDAFPWATFVQICCQTL